MAQKKKVFFVGDATKRPAGKSNEFTILFTFS